jgi:hypothetical protein
MCLAPGRAGRPGLGRAGPGRPWECTRCHGPGPGCAGTGLRVQGACGPLCAGHGDSDRKTEQTDSDSVRDAGRQAGNAGTQERRQRAACHTSSEFNFHVIIRDHHERPGRSDGAGESVRAGMSLDIRVQLKDSKTPNSTSRQLSSTRPQSPITAARNRGYPDRVSC